ncbi:MAG: c-type cytochrome [Usitatibacter sp.]
MKKFLAPALLALALPAAASGDAEVGKKISTPCAACHGANGISPSPAFPNLAGQYPDYIETALRHYQNGRRKNPIMKVQVEKLTPKNIEDLAAYFSSQPGLKVKH